jgi:hypothetical protein
VSDASQTVRIGPPWGAVADPEAKVVKRMFRPVCRFDEVKQLRVREYFDQEEEEQLLDRNPDVQKRPRQAELYADTTDGRAVWIADLDQAGLLLDRAAAMAGLMGGVPVLAERVHVGDREA